MPSSEAIEENTANQSSGCPSVARWSCQAPATFGVQTRSSWSSATLAITASSSTMAQCTTPCSRKPSATAVDTSRAATSGSAMSPRTTDTLVVLPITAARVCAASGTGRSGR